MFIYREKNCVDVCIRLQGEFGLTWISGDFNAVFNRKDTFSLCRT